MKAAVSILMLLLGAAAAVLADTPQPAPATYEVASSNGKYFAFVDARNKSTIVFDNQNPRVRRELWRIPGYHTSVFVSDDGGYLVIGYAGQNLLPLDYTKDTVAFTVYHDGKMTGQVTFGELIHDFSKLKMTASHYSWGSILSLSDHSLLIDTVEGQKTFDVQSLTFIQ